MCAKLGLSGDLYLNYKGGKRYRCVQRGHYFKPEDSGIPAAVKVEAVVIPEQWPQIRDSTVEGTQFPFW